MAAKARFCDSAATPTTSAASAMTFAVVSAATTSVAVAATDQREEVLRRSCAAADRRRETLAAFVRPGEEALVALGGRVPRAMARGRPRPESTVTFPAPVLQLPSLRTGRSRGHGGTAWTLECVTKPVAASLVMLRPAAAITTDSSRGRCGRQKSTEITSCARDGSRPTSGGGS